MFAANVERTFFTTYNRDSEMIMTRGWQHKQNFHLVQCAVGENKRLFNFFVCHCDATVVTMKGQVKAIVNSRFDVSNQLFWTFVIFVFSSSCVSVLCESEVYIYYLEVSLFESWEKNEYFMKPFHSVFSDDHWVIILISSFRRFSVSRKYF